ncbi:MAG: 16S rRNA (cytosine(1402)-N(4))-methyltransferase RsmH [bacterium]|nr:16S rRNA (cytosine(1402)-N(4))-methyltransferase RsmH [bacterium]
MRTRRPQSSSDPVLGTQHRPVLLHEAVEFLALKPDDTVVDATLGEAGHALASIGELGEHGIFVGFDLDSDAIERAREMLKGAAPEVHIVEANFRALARELSTRGISRVDKVLFDLGWSSRQLNSGRGFSLKGDEPLLMTYSKGVTALTAATIVNKWSEESLADVIFGWGEERYSRRIAKAIVEHRFEKPFTTARELAEAIYAAVPPRYRHGRIHPATRTFQALRIAVNDELGALREGLANAWKVLSKDGRIAVITFHSIEDRLVKQTFKLWEDSGEGKRLTKKPLTPSAEEIRDNPRSRSAKLRVIEKL